LCAEEEQELTTPRWDWLGRLNKAQPISKQTFDYSTANGAAAEHRKLQTITVLECAGQQLVDDKRRRFFLLLTVNTVQ
jgi:hypothetical protein